MFHRTYVVARLSVFCMDSSTAFLTRTTSYR